MKKRKWLTIAVLVVGSMVTAYTGNPMAGKAAGVAVESVGSHALEQIDD
tara:strand:- start:96943 stop:97089 length:147 start_codon:yes stop_codon:yes gene_type:complete